MLAVEIVDLVEERSMTVRIGEDCEVVLQCPLVSLGAVLAIIDLDALHITSLEEFGVLGVPLGFIRCMLVPLRMIPECESSLLVSLFQSCLGGLGVVVVELFGLSDDRLVVLYEDAVPMTGRHLAGNLTTVDYNQVGTLGCLCCDFVRSVTVALLLVEEAQFYHLLVTCVDMLGDGDRIYTFPYSLLYAGCGPYGGVREYGVQVEIALQSFVTLDVGNDNLVGGVG